MTMVKLITSVLIALRFCHNFVLETDKVYDELNIFMDKVKFCHKEDGHTCYYTGTNASRDFINSFISKNDECGTFITNSNNSLAYGVGIFFVFVEYTEELAEAAANLIENPLWKPTAYCFFILTVQIEDLSFLPEALSYIWSKNILNFLLTFVHHTYEAYTFLPFAEQKVFSLKHTAHFCDYRSLRKVTNLNRHPLRAAFFEYPPGIYKENGKWTGTDVDIFLLLTEMLNATPKCIPCNSANDSVPYIYANQADILIVRVFQLRYFENVSFSYSYEMGDRVAVVPKPSKIPPHEYIFFIFDFETWLTLLFTIIFLSIVYFITGYAFGLNLDYFPTILPPLVSVGIAHNLMNKTKLKWLLAIWVYSTFVLGVIFQTSLTKSFVKPRLGRNIRTIEDLKNSQMKIYIHPFLTQPSLIPEAFGLRKSYVNTSTNDLVQLLRERNTSGAFIVSRQLAKYCINQNKREYGDPIYEIMQEVLIPGSMVYLLQKTSPFLEKINKCLLLIKEHGLQKRSDYNIVTVCEGNLLKLSHFLVTFHLLFLGYFAGTIAFIVEMYLGSTVKRNNE